MKELLIYLFKLVLSLFSTKKKNTDPPEEEESQPVEVIFTNSEEFQQAENTYKEQSNDLNMKKITVILGTAHLKDTAGKRSPDGRIQEYSYSRRLCKAIKTSLISRGINCVIDFEGDTMTNSSQSAELSARVKVVNEICNREGSKNCVYVPIHLNAASADGNWRKATGWECWVSDNASENSKKLANILHNTAAQLGLKTRQPSSMQKYWEGSLYVCKKSLCPAVLTENLFQDSKEDVEFLLSMEGFSLLVDLHVRGILSYVNSL